MGPALRHILALVSLGAAAAAPLPGPEAVIARIYGRYQSAETYSVFGTDSEVRRTFSAPLAGLLSADARYQVRTQSVGCFDSDPFIVGQDYKITAVQVSSVADPATPARAIVTAAFRNFEQPVVVRFDMLDGPSGWTIDDLRSDAYGSFKANLRRCLRAR